MLRWPHLYVTTSLGELFCQQPESHHLLTVIFRWHSSIASKTGFWEDLSIYDMTSDERLRLVFRLKRIVVIGLACLRTDSQGRVRTQLYLNIKNYYNTINNRGIVVKSFWGQMYGQNHLMRKEKLNLLPKRVLSINSPPPFVVFFFGRSRGLHYVSSETSEASHAFISEFEIFHLFKLL